ncbi:FecR family protein, partial [Arcobacter sp.]|uniref:FecR family protein n=1 Tax=Arcobacter sp. TaxID=1872629 RepID=UPI003C723F90
TIITIGQNSTLNIFDYVYDESNPKDSKASFGFMKGSFKSITGKIGKINKERFKLKTKSASIGIRGTTIIGNQQIIICTDGAISVTANGVTVDVAKQELTRTLQGEAPTPPEPLKQDTLDNLEQQTGGGNGGGEQNNNKTNNSTKNNTLKAPPVVNNTPNNDPVKYELPTVRYKKKEHSNLSGFTTLGYANTIIKDSNNNDAFESFKNGEMGIKGFDSSITQGTIGNSSRINIDNNKVLDSTLKNGTSIGTFSDENETYLSWGEWQGTSQNNITYTGGWIAGTKTAGSIILDLIGGLTTSKTFTGNVIHGDIYDGSTLYDISDQSTVNFTFNFGGGNNSFTGNMNLLYNEGNSEYKINFKNGGVNSSGFSSSSLTHNSNSITGKVNGSFYGTGSIKAIGGKFDFKDGEIEGSGLFKAQ